MGSAGAFMTERPSSTETALSCAAERVRDARDQHERAGLRQSSPEAAVAYSQAASALALALSDMDRAVAAAATITHTPP